MTDEPTPTPPKVPPKLKIRPAASPASSETGGDSSAQAEPRKDTAAETPQAPKTVTPINPPANKDSQKPAASEAPTLVLKKSPVSSAEQQNKKKTSRIPLDIALTSRIDTAMEASADEAPKTIRLARPGTAKPATPSTAAGEAAPKTIRLTSPTAAPPSSDGADSGPKTIRLQRPVDAPTKAFPAEDDSSDQRPASKSKTSRISLDEVLQSDLKASGGGATGVKTIRLKRPGEVASPQAPPAAESVKPEGDDEKSRTARLDKPETATPDSDEGAPATQRKTIRIKRPDGTVAGGGPKPARKLTLAKDAPQDQAETEGDETAEPETAAEPEAAKRSADEKIGLVWSLAAVAAVLVAAVVVYVLAVQAFPGADLAWPGQINL